VSDLPPIDSPETFAGWHMPWPDFEVDWKRAAIVVVDMQNYGCNPDVGLMPMLSSRYPEIARYYLSRVTEIAVPNAARLLEGFRAAECRVVFTRHGPLLADGSDMIARRRRRDVEALAITGTPALWHRGTFEHEVIAVARQYAPCASLMESIELTLWPNHESQNR
jgi:nicotinamidase-related amidase